MNKSSKSPCNLFASLSISASNSSRTPAIAHATMPYRGTVAGHKSLSNSCRGTGVYFDTEGALTRATSECLEHFSAAVVRQDELITAAQVDLQQPMLDLLSVASCSAVELANPKCSLIQADIFKPIRWIPGFSPTLRQQVLIPAIMTFVQDCYRMPAERFWLPISTGCSAHITYEKALLTAIFEIVERESLAMLWLQKFALPEIEIDMCAEGLASCMQYLQHDPDSVSYSFFNATFDTAFPTVYAVRKSDKSSHACTMVTCSTAATFDEALIKVILDMFMLRNAFRRKLVFPEHLEDFTEMLHGAAYMGQSHLKSQFHFLNRSSNVQKLSHLSFGQPPISLSGAITKLRDLDLDLYVVDLTTREAEFSGLKVVRAIIPKMLPLSFRYTARFLGTPRLYSVPLNIGQESLSEDRLNSNPQPFA